MEPQTGIGLINLIINIWSKLISGVKRFWLWMQRKICRDVYRENQQLKDQLNRVNSIKYDQSMNVYWDISGSEKDGPFCPRCWEKDKRLSRFGSWGLDIKCNVCNKVIGNKNQENEDEGWAKFFNGIWK